MDVSALASHWDARWPGSRPIAHDLRYAHDDRWVRFHSLPKSKRYPENEAEYAEVHRRHVTVMAELIDAMGQTLDQEVLVVTASWSSTGTRVRRERHLRRRFKATYWRSILEDHDDSEEWWIHLFVSHVRVDSAAMTRLLRLVADDRTAQVIITDLDLTWLYLPYDGGADVIAASGVLRDDLRGRHRDWLSTHPRGM